METTLGRVHTIDLKFMGQAQVIACYVIEGEGGLLLVDPGPDTCFAHLQSAVEDLGFDWQAVTDVLLTHIHFDHAGAAWRFAEAGATVHVHPLGEKHLADPERLWGSAARIYGEVGMESLWGQMKPIPGAQLRTWDNAETRGTCGLAVQALHTPGHAKHHIAWRVAEDIYLGDVGGVCIEDGPVEPPCPPPDIDIGRWKESLRKLAQLTDVRNAYRSHFGGFDGSRLGESCAQLDQALDRWVSYYQAAFEGTPEEGTQSFIEKVEGDRPTALRTRINWRTPPL